MTTYLGKSCSFGLPRVPFVNCGQFMYLVISLLVLRAGCGICLYQFLIIAYLFTSFIQSNLEFLKNVMVQECVVLIKWFANNLMQANADKFQGICIGKKTYEAVKHFQINDTVVQCESNATFLGVNIDFMLNFNEHVREICKKASKQLAVLKRLRKYLTKQGKLTFFNSFILSKF